MKVSCGTGWLTLQKLCTEAKTNESVNSSRLRQARIKRKTEERETEEKNDRVGAVTATARCGARNIREGQLIRVVRQPLDVFLELVAGGKEAVSIDTADAHKQFSQHKSLT